MNFQLDNPSRRIAFAIGISVLLHGLALWGPKIKMPSFKSALPPLQAKLVAIPGGAIKHKKTRAKPAPKPAPEVAQVEPSQLQDPTPIAASEPVTASAVAAASAVEAASAVTAASTPTEAETLAAANDKAPERPALPRRAQLSFAINKGTGGFRIGEAVHTLEIDDGHYVLYSVTQTVGLVRLFKSYELTQYSSGSYGKDGLVPEQFFEERKESSGTQRNTAEFDHAAGVIRFSQGNQLSLPADTQDILSIMYQFPPLANTKIATVSVSNGKKVERYDFEVIPDETIATALGNLLTVRLHKMHGPNEEGLDIWLAREYRLFPVKMRFFERNGDVAGEAVITDIRVSDEEGARTNAVN